LLLCAAPQNNRALLPKSVHVREWFGKASQGNSLSYMQSPSRFPSKAGGALAAGGRPDKQSYSFFEVLVAAVEGCPGEVDARCKAQFHRKENGAGYRKPEELNETLNMIRKGTNVCQK
jgi:hypothetical protein